MKQYNLNFRLLLSFFLVVSIGGVISSCNKALPEAVPITYPDTNPGAAMTIGEKISSDPNFSIYLAAVKRVGLLAKLSDPKNVFTVFAPDNAGFIRSGIASDAVIAALPIASVGGIVQYSIVPGHQYMSADIPTDFPNLQSPTALNIGVLPGTTVPLQMTIFPSKGANGFWVNNVPVVAADMQAKNGVIQQTYAVVAPPTGVLKDLIYANPDLSFYKAAIARADSGQTGTNSFDYLLGYGVTNMTVLVPNNAAFQELLIGSIAGYLISVGTNPVDAMAQASALAATPAVFSNPALYSVLTAEMVRGILAYHFLATNANGSYQPAFRAFSNNFSTTPAYYKTLVNGSVGVHPGILVTPTYTGPAVSAISFTGLGTFPPGGAPFSGTPAHAVSKDNNAVNGVYYVIDKVLLPQ